MREANLAPDSSLKSFSVYTEHDLMELARDMINRKIEVDGEKALESVLAEVGFVRERTCHDEGGINTNYPAVFICSECKWRSPVFTFGKGMPQFCPSCGAKVVEHG